MKKILFYLIRYPGYGGIESVTTIVVNKLVEFNYDITIISYLHENQEELLPTIHPKVKLFYMPNERNWHDLANLKFLEELYCKFNFDITIHQDSYADTQSFLHETAKKFKSRLFIFEHNTPLYAELAIRERVRTARLISLRGVYYSLFFLYHISKNRKIQSLRREYLYENCEKYILLSEALKCDFQRVLKRNEYEKLLAISNPIAIDGTFSNITKENIILFVGRLTKVKNVDKLIYFWSKVAKKHNDWKFVIVGDGEERSNLENYVVKLGVENVYFEGFKDPTQYYKKAKVFLMASTFEGFGMTLVESMQFGVVPLAFNSFSSIVDIVDDRVGMLIKNNDRGKFIDALNNVMSDSVKLECMSKNAIDKAKQFDINSIISKWISLIENTK